MASNGEAGRAYCVRQRFGLCEAGSALKELCATPLAAVDAREARQPVADAARVKALERNRSDSQGSIDE